MNPIKTINPTECIIASLFGSNFFPLIASIPNINNLPPSSAGIGSKFNIPRFKLITAAIYIRLIIPILAASETIPITPTGPATEFSNPPGIVEQQMLTFA